MKKLRSISIITLTLWAICCNGQTKHSNPDSTSKADPYYQFSPDYDVSLIRLLANPEKYDGKHVRVCGYLNVEFEGDALYFHQEDYLAHISKNGLWVNLNSSGKVAREAARFNKKYVVIEAVFDGNDTGHMGLFGGGLKDIIRIYLWHQPNEKQ